MRIALFGGTGRVGSRMMNEFLEEGHEVIALARNPEKMPSHANLTVIQGDALDEQAIAMTIQDAEAVVRALGTDKTTTLSEGVPHMIRVMKDEHIKRVVTIVTAGILQSRTEPGKLRYQAKDSKRKLTTAAEEHHKAFDALAASGLDWTIVCPTYLPDGETTGTYRIEDNWLPVDSEKISTGDTAQFAVRELTKEEHIGCRVGIAY